MTNISKYGNSVFLLLEFIKIYIDYSIMKVSYRQ